MTAPRELTVEEEYRLAVALGVTDGTRPNQPATRYQAAIMAIRAARIAELLENVILED